MKSNFFILVVYDISSDKRRTKLHNALMDFGTPVQYSVFECLLSAKDKERLEKRVAKIIRPRKDHVRYYSLCTECVGKIVVVGGKEALSHHPNSIVVG